MRPGQFYDRPPIHPMQPARCIRGKQIYLHLKTPSYTVFNIDKQGIQQVQADFLQSDSTSPAYIKNKPDISQLTPGSAWDERETPQDQGNSGMFWND